MVIGTSLETTLSIYNLQKQAQAVTTAFNKHEANVIVGETNNGGDLVKMNLKTVDPSIPFKIVHTSMDKQ